MPDHSTIIDHEKSTALAVVDKTSTRLANAGVDEITPARIAAAEKRLTAATPLDRACATGGIMAIVLALPTAFLLPAAPVVAPIIATIGFGALLVSGISNHRKIKQARMLLSEAARQNAARRAREQSDLREKIRERGLRLRAEASGVLDQVIAAAMVSEGQNILFADPDSCNSKLRVRVTEVAECHDADTGALVLRVTVRLYEATTAAELAGATEIDGVGPILREYPLSGVAAMMAALDRGRLIDPPAPTKLDPARSPNSRPVPASPRGSPSP
jgi:hypothetical protein